MLKSEICYSGRSCYWEICGKKVCKLYSGCKNEKGYSYCNPFIFKLLLLDLNQRPSD
jgi:hypothetical protein